MKNNRMGYVFGLAFFALTFWLIYVRIVFDFYFKSHFKQNMLTHILHWFIASFDLTEFKIKAICITACAFMYYFYKNYTKKSYQINRYYWIAFFSFLFVLYPSQSALHLYTPLAVLVCTLPFPMLLHSTLAIKKIQYSRKIDQDQFNLENQTFKQESKPINTTTSLNFVYEYIYEGKKYIGYLNLVEIFRSVWIYGVMGSGKTFTFFLSAIYQLIDKGFAMVVYDYKFPSMSEATYTYYKELKPDADFYQICLTDMRYSNRCNPIEPKYIPSGDDIEMVSHTVLTNLSDQDKENPFFSGSAEGIFSALISVSKKMQAKYDILVCSIPHAVILASVKIKYLLPVLLSHRDVLVQITSLRDAFDKGAAEEQLTGQTSTLQQKLKSLFNKDFFYIASGKSDFSLDINDPHDKKILTLGGSADKTDIISPYTSLYFDIISKRTNKKGKAKFMMVIDEFAQMYFKGVKSFLETGREHYNGLLAGMQGVPQLYDKTPERLANSIVDIQGTVITGMAGKKTADLASEKIGKTNQKRSSISVNDDVSLNHSFYESPLVPPSRIANFTTGEFCGVVADKFENPIKQKRFLGKFLPDKNITKIKKNLKLPQIYSFESEKTLQVIADIWKDFKEINFFKIYKKSILNNDFSSIPENVNFYFKFLLLDDAFFRSEHKHIQKLLKTDYQNKLISEKKKSKGKYIAFDLDIYIDNFFKKLLKKIVLDNEKELFLNKHLDSIYDDVEFWIRKEYQLVTGEIIDDDLFKIRNSTSDDKDNLYI